MKVVMVLVGVNANQAAAILRRTIADEGGEYVALELDRIEPKEGWVVVGASAGQVGVKYIVGLHRIPEEEVPDLADHARQATKAVISEDREYFGTHPKIREWLQNKKW